MTSRSRETAESALTVEPGPHLRALRRAITIALEHDETLSLDEITILENVLLPTIDDVLGSTDLVVSWDELCPEGARRFYEGDDPETFRTEMLAMFGFDPATDDPEFGWCEEKGWAFTIPAGLVEAVYGSERWPLGS